ncbi:deoxyribodipyrimidine photolyase [Calothrix sp. HK-06]|nr:deoxyribodipyrimidine photolyase [Calothrix sp. HK-06]
MTNDMRRDFANREELGTYLKKQFPEAAERDDHISQIIGGRQAAVAALQKVDPVKYAKSRNFLTGAVTRLSPYIRYGVLGLREARDFAFSKIRNQDEAAKFVNELGWRDYWQRLYMKLGDGIWKDQEEYKTGYSASEYATELPQDIREGTTGLVCIDSFSRDLREIGYLHNHMRMWLAAYIVHWRRVRWQEGTKWFLEHLLDGDPASNNMSWQWVASTFSHKPYFFNRENLERYTEGVYCKKCPLYGKCDFEGSYEKLEAKLFPKGEFVKKDNSQSWQKGKRRK